MVSNKKVLEAANTIVEFCHQQCGCQNCILRRHGADRWYCQIGAFDLSEVLRNIEAKKKNHGYL